MNGHDIIVVGASAGGVEALCVLVSGLPRDFPGTVFVVIHLPPNAPSVLASILGRRGPLPVVAASDGMTFKPGHIYVARPDHHLLVREGHVHLAAGPRENGHRPAIDPLFRSAALTYGSRVVGVVLSGNLDDGSAGLSAVKARGGIAIVQDPAEALYPDMPANAIRNVEVDQVLPVARISMALDQLARSSADETVPADKDPDPPGQSAIPEMDRRVSRDEMHSGASSGFACPDCGGALFELKERDFDRYRCGVGHAFSPETLLSKQSDSFENALWIALRAMEESAALCARLAARSQNRNDRDTYRRFAARAESAQNQALRIRGWLNGRFSVEESAGSPAHGEHGRAAPGGRAGSMERPESR